MVNTSFSGNSGGTAIPMNQGAYEVTEAQIAGYTGTFSADCTGTILVGQTKTCTITNNDIQPTLIVIKEVENNFKGTAVD